MYCAVSGGTRCSKPTLTQQTQASRGQQYLKSVSELHRGNTRPLNAQALVAYHCHSDLHPHTVPSILISTAWHGSSLQPRVEAFPTASGSLCRNLMEPQIQAWEPFLMQLAQSFIPQGLACFKQGARSCHACGSVRVAVWLDSMWLFNSAGEICKSE